MNDQEAGDEALARLVALYGLKPLSDPGSEARKLEAEARCALQYVYGRRDADQPPLTERQQIAVAILFPVPGHELKPPESEPAPLPEFNIRQFTRFGHKELGNRPCINMPIRPEPDWIPPPESRGT